jgi:hypothetical protein
MKESLGLFFDEVTPAPGEGQGIDHDMTFFDETVASAVHSL